MSLSEAFEGVRSVFCGCGVEHAPLASYESASTIKRYFTLLTDPFSALTSYRSD